MLQLNWLLGVVVGDGVDSLTRGSLHLANQFFESRNSF
jgi:hypothetical protein